MFSPSSNNAGTGSGFNLTVDNAQTQFSSPILRDAMNISSSTAAAGNGLFGNGNGDGSGGVPQFAPNFLFGAQHASKRRNLALSGAISRPGMGSPGILKTKEANLSPGSKNVHWSPLLVRERSSSPGSKKDEHQTKGDFQQKQQAIANSLWNGPPLRSIRDDLGPPDKQQRLDTSSTQLGNGSTSFNNVSSIHDFEGAETSYAPENDKDFWVTIFGFPSDQTSAVLGLFAKHGNIVSQKTPKAGNWVHVRYSSTVHARQALARNAKIFDGVMIGVVPCTDRDVISEEGVAVSTTPAVHVFNSSSSTNNDFLLNGSRMVPSVSNSANTSLPNRSRFSISSRAGMRPLNGSFASETSGNPNLSSTQKGSEGSYLGKLWSYVYNP